jgi:hypothetical protein
MTSLTPDERAELRETIKMRRLTAMTPEGERLWDDLGRAVDDSERCADLEIHIEHLETGMGDAINGVYGLDGLSIRRALAAVIDATPDPLECMAARLDAALERVKGLEDGLRGLRRWKINTPVPTCSLDDNGQFVQHHDVRALLASGKGNDDE